MKSHFFVAAALLASILYSTSASADVCSDLQGRKFGDATVTLARTVPAGDFSINSVSGNRPSVERGLPAFCKIKGVAKPVPASNIGFELWLPADKWNSKLQMFGNGGYSSSISYDSLADYLKRGYATLGTDTGHSENPDIFVESATNPEVIVDWGYRAVHESVVAAKLILSSYYGSMAKRSYFSGCSTGGQQALTEAQRFPADFDGIIAGDPGNNRTHLNAGFLWQFIQNREPGDSSGSAKIMPDDKLAIVTKAAVQQCHATDKNGLETDSFLTDPRTCHFDPAMLQCKKGEDTAQCLTKPQVSAMKAMYAGAGSGKGSGVIYPGWPVGSESGWDRYWESSSDPAEPMRVGFWRYWAFGDLSWDWWTFDWNGMMKAVDDKLASLINAMNPDLSAFKQSGGKLLQYHGWADPVVAPDDSIDYYERVVSQQQRQTLRGDALAETQKFYRLFMVPGMGHCRGGEGADSFDAQAALEKWVEQGEAPERIVATKYVASPSRRNGNTPEPAPSAPREAFTRPICVYPKVPKYNGTGDSNNAANFTCVAAARGASISPDEDFLR